MNLTSARPSLQNPLRAFSGIRIRSGFVYTLIIIVAMAAFEVFNYATTVYALEDLLGDLTFFGISWATFLALAFCGIDFAGIASLISQPHERANKDTWYLFGAWLLAGSANAALTWWGVTMAITSHSSVSSALISASMLVKVVPIFVAILVWVIRVLIISSLATALERMTSRRMPQHNSVNPQVRASYPTNRVPVSQSAAHTGVPVRSTVTSRTPITPASQPQRVEPTYHPLSTSTFDADGQDHSTRRM